MRTGRPCRRSAEHCRSLGLAVQKCPEQLELVDALPRNSYGKVLKQELRARLGLSHACGTSTTLPATRRCSRSSSAVAASSSAYAVGSAGRMR